MNKLIGLGLIFLCSCNNMKLTEKFERHYRENKNHYVSNNVWGKDLNNKQEIEITENGFKVVDTNFNNDAYVNSFPSVIYGHHPHGKAVSKGWQYHKIKDIYKLNAEIKTITKKGGRWNSIIDIWLDDTLHVEDGPTSKGVEILIWLRGSDLKPAGRLIGETRLREKDKWVNYYIYHLSPIPWGKWKDYIAYVRMEDTDELYIDLHSVFYDAVVRGWVSPNQYLIAVEGGFEIGHEGNGLELIKFELEF